MLADGDTSFALNKLSPPTTGDVGLYGVDKSDPQPPTYPALTTFFLRTSASKPVFLGTMGSSYLYMSALKDVNNFLSINVSLRSQYTGTCKKVWDGGSLQNFPMDLNAFQPDPGNLYYIRFYDSFDKLDFFKPASTSNSVKIYAVPSSFAWRPNTSYPVPGKVIRFSFGNGWQVTLEYVNIAPTVNLGDKWDGSTFTVRTDTSQNTSDFIVFQSK